MGPFFQIDQPIEDMTNFVVPSYLPAYRNFNLWPFECLKKMVVWFHHHKSLFVFLMASTREGSVELNKTFQEMVGGNMIEKNHPEIL